jgi:hypothetical protein
MENNLICNIKPAQVICAGVILLCTSTPRAAVIINEIDYDQPGSDNAEFIELFNPGTNPVSLDGYTIDLVNGSNGSAYSSFDLTGLTVSPNGYLVLCDDMLAVANCDIDVTSSGWIQNGGTDGDAVALLSGGTLVDSIVYEGLSSFLAPYAEGGSFTIADSNSIAMSIGRLPNGIDSNMNSTDFDSACISPGSFNISGTGDCSSSMSPVPLPAAAWLFGSGLAGLIGISRRKHNVLSR